MDGAGEGRKRRASDMASSSPRPVNKQQKMYETSSYSWSEDLSAEETMDSYDPDDKSDDDDMSDGAAPGFYFVLARPLGPGMEITKEWLILNCPLVIEARDGDSARGAIEDDFMWPDVEFAALPTSSDDMNLSKKEMGIPERAFVAWAYPTRDESIFDVSPYERAKEHSGDNAKITMEYVRSIILVLDAFRTSLSSHSEDDSEDAKAFFPSWQVSKS